MDEIKLKRQKEIFSKLMLWLNKNGARFPNIIIEHVSSIYRGIKASKYIKPNSRFISIPFKCIMSVEKAKKSEVGKLLDDVKFSPDNDHDWLALFLLSEKQKGVKSFFKPYIDTIPSHYNNFPHYYTKKEKEQLRGSFVLDMMYSRKLELQDNYEKLKKGTSRFFKKLNIR